MEFKNKLKEYQEIVEKELEKNVRKNKCLEERLNNSMEYSLMAGGKRLRPILVIATYELFKKDIEKCFENIGLEKNVRGEKLTLEQFEKIAESINKRKELPKFVNVLKYGLRKMSFCDIKYNIM